MAREMVLGLEKEMRSRNVTSLRRWRTYFPRRRVKVTRMTKSEMVALALEISWKMKDQDPVKAQVWYHNLHSLSLQILVLLQ